MELFQVCRQQGTERLVDLGLWREGATAALLLWKQGETPAPPAPPAPLPSSRTPALPAY